MPTKCKPYLCGGVFLTYVMKARKQRAGVREHYMGESDGLSDPDLFFDLIKIMNPSAVKHASKTFKENTSSYKNCRKNSGAYLPFGSDSVEVQTFDTCIRSEYNIALSRMHSFVEKYLDVGSETKKDEYLVKALIEIIQSDDLISNDDIFYCKETGTPTTKQVLVKETAVHLEAFLVGVWHYILTNRFDNMSGRVTLNTWSPTISDSKIKLSYFNNAAQEPDEQPSDTESDPEPDIYEQKQDNDSQTDSTNQTVNNPVIFNQYGNNGVQIGSIETLTINHNK